MSCRIKLLSDEGEISALMPSLVKWACGQGFGSLNDILFLKDSTLCSRILVTVTSPLHSPEFVPLENCRGMQLLTWIMNSSEADPEQSLEQGTRG